MLDGIFHYELEVYSERERESTQNEHGGWLASGMVAFSEALYFRREAGRVGEPKGGAQEMESEENGLLVCRTSRRSRGTPDSARSTCIHIEREAPGRKAGVTPA